MLWHSVSNLINIEVQQLLCLAQIKSKEEQVAEAEDPHLDNIIFAKGLEWKEEVSGCK